MSRKLPGMRYRDCDHTYVDCENGRIVPAERIDEYAMEKLDAALEKLARALVESHLRAGSDPMKILR